MKRTFTHIIAIFLVISLPSFAIAQTGFSSQDEMKKKAEEYFKNEDYSAAMPLYSQLVSLYPKDPLYNYRFGVSILFADRRETEKPIRYLKFASTTRNVDKSVFYYLGLAYHNNYRFSEAIAKYNIYKQEAGTKIIQKRNIDRQIEICNNAMELLTRFSTLYVMEKTEVSYKDFFRSYDVERFGGKLLVKPELFQSTYDKKNEKLGLVFYSSGLDVAFFSSYGRDGKNGKDIYMVKKMWNGQWGRPENLGNVINTEYDEDFPFMTPDSTLYFSSKGSYTIGGYDIFSSKLNKDGSWSEPENLNFPINTPFDDIMFIPDSSKQYAYFSSDRASLEGMINVYKVRIDKRIPLAENISFDNKDADTSKFIAQNEEIVQFLKEKATLDVNADESMFDETLLADNATAANIDTTTDIDTEVDLDTATTATATTTTSTNYKAKEIEMDSLLAVNDMNNEAIMAMAEKHAKRVIDELRGYSEKKDAADEIAKSKNQLANDKYEQAAIIQSNAENISDNNKKHEELAKAKKLQYEADQLNKESAIAAKIADDFGEQLSIKQKESDDATQYANNIKAAVQSNSTDSSNAMLTRMIDDLQSSTVDTNYIASIDLGKEFISEKENESNELYNEAKQLAEEVDLLKSQADEYRQNASNAKKKSQKAEYMKTAAELDDQAKTKQAEVDAELQKAEKLQAQADSARYEAAVYATVVDDILSNRTAQTDQTLANNQTTANNNTVTDQNIDNTTDQSLASDTILADDKSQSIAEEKQLTTEEQEIKKDIRSNTVEIADVVEKSSDSLKTLSAKAYALAYEKNKQSIAKKTESNNLIAAASETANTDVKEKYLQDAEELHKESVVLAQQAVISYNIAKQIDSVYEENIKDVAEINKTINNINILIDSNNIDDANDHYNDLQSRIAVMSNIGDASKSYQSVVANELDVKEYILQQTNEEEIKIQAKADSLVEIAQILWQEANDETKRSKKKELQKELAFVEQQAIIMQAKADTARANAEKLEIEVGEMKIKFKYSTTLLDEISEYKTTTTVDKVELGKNVQEYTDNDIFAEVSPISISSETEENNAIDMDLAEDSLSDMQVADATNNESDVSNNTVVEQDIIVSQNNSVTTVDTAVIENTSGITSVNKVNVSYQNNAQQEEFKADLIDKTVSAIDNNIAAIQANLSKETDQVRKNEMAIEIAELQNESAKLKQEAAESHQIAAALNNSMADTDIAITDDSVLVQILNDDANKYLDNASQKRLDANAANDNNEKTNLTIEANELEKSANAMLLQAMEITGISNQNKYYTNNIQLVRVKTIDDGNPQLTVAELIENESKMYFEKAKELRDSVSENMGFNQKRLLLDEAKKNELLAIQKQLKAIEIYAKVSPTLANIIDSDTNQNSSAFGNVTSNDNLEVNAAGNDEIINNINADSNITADNSGNDNAENKVIDQNATDYDSSNNDNVAANNNDNLIVNSSNNNDNNISVKGIPVLITANDFKGIYITPGNSAPLNVDAANLIPLDPVLPNGIIFKVQICAVRRHCAPEVFSGVTPLVGEVSPTGLIRYMAGLFAAYDDARASRDILRGMGYADAFVVAYLNGKRITNAEARAMLNNNNTFTTTYAQLNNITYVSSGPTNIETPVAQANNIPAGLNNPIENINGLFYSVQVGVYARPVTSAQLFNITPLFDETMANGYFRYLSGIYSSIQDATNAKNTIVVQGVKDAFVVVYYNGKKITFAEARDLIATNTKFANDTSTDEETSVITQTTTKPDQTETAEEIIATETVADKSGIVFKVQLGAYKNDVPVDVVNKFLDVVKDKGLEHTQDANGLTIYTSGNYIDFYSANEYKATITAQGIPDAFVVAYQNGVKISVVKALELLK